jgi:hypothetical protein
LPITWKGQELSCHDKLAKRLRQKTMEACALAGRPTDVGKGLNLSREQNMVKGKNATCEMFGIITNLSRPAAGNYTYRLL